ncbi:MAG: cupin domain-containing protein [Verrucomicrobiia bacterium]
MNQEQRRSADPSATVTALSGKITRCTLPAFDKPQGPDAPRLKRLLLPQGELAQMHDGDEPILYLAFIELRDGTVRGNHFHKSKKEYVYMLEGEVLLVAEDIESKTRETLRLEAGQLAVILPGVAHAMQVVKPGGAIEYSPARFDAEDTYRYPVT